MPDFKEAADSVRIAALGTCFSERTKCNRANVSEGFAHGLAVGCHTKCACTLHKNILLLRNDCMLRSLYVYSIATQAVLLGNIIVVANRIVISVPSFLSQYWSTHEKAATVRVSRTTELLRIAAWTLLYKLTELAIPKQFFYLDAPMRLSIALRSIAP